MHNVEYCVCALLEKQIWVSRKRKKVSTGRVGVNEVGNDDAEFDHCAQWKKNKTVGQTARWCSGCRVNSWKTDFGLSQRQEGPHQ